VSDAEKGIVLELLPNRLLDLGVRLEIDRCCCLVEDDDAGLLSDEGTSEGDERALSDREVVALLLDHGVK
jgi:hypothetical protein